MPREKPVRPLIPAILMLLPGMAVAQAPDSAFVSWARRHAVDLTSPESERAALPGLGRLVDGVELIGVGESVHNVQEFLELRFALLKELVTRHRVTALLLESGFPESVALDAYVAGRTDYVDFETSFTYGFGSFAVVRETIHWLREWNRGPGKAAPVRVVGVDLPGSAGSMVPALDLLTEMLGYRNHEVATLIDRQLRPLAVRAAGSSHRSAAAAYAQLGPAARDSLAAGVQRLGALIRQGSDLGSSERAETIRRLALATEQLLALLELGGYHRDNPRDAAMAANTEWALSRLGSGQRAVLWAHNAHVQRVPIEGPSSPAPDPVPSMGVLLDRKLGKRYLAIGTAYGGPSVDSASAPATGSLDATLATVGASRFLLAFAPMPGGAARDWLDRPRLIRFQVGHLRVPAGKAFDVIAFFDRVAGAHRAP